MVRVLVVFFDAGHSGRKFCLSGLVNLSIIACDERGDFIFY